MLISQLIENDITNEIEKENKEQFDIAEIVIDDIVPELLEKLNNLDGSNKEINTINQAVFILYSQIFMTYKSTLLLLLNGYFSNGLINLRNLFDAFFNIKYIGNGKYEDQLKKATKYISKPDRSWTSSSVKDRALTIQEKNLYTIYELICNYSHANYMGAGQQYDGEKINISPQTNKIREAVIHTNAVFLYCTEFVANRYNLCIDNLDNMLKNEEIADSINVMSYEKFVRNLLKSLFENMVSDADFEKIFHDYLEFEKKRK